MANETYAIKGGSDVKWGVAATSALGTVIDHKVENDAKYETVENEYGAVTGIVVYDTETVIKLTIIAKAAAALPTMGDSITVGGLTAIVLHAAENANNKTTVKIEITANKWAHLSISA